MHEFLLYFLNFYKEKIKPNYKFNYKVQNAGNKIFIIFIFLQKNIENPNDDNQKVKCSIRFPKLRRFLRESKSP